jgi:hypothetical protein
MSEACGTHYMKTCNTLSVPTLYDVLMDNILYNACAIQ